MAFLLPVPGSKEPFRVADVNTWFQTIDTKFQSVDGVATGLGNRLTAIEPFLLPGYAEPTAKHGLVPAGTTAERDAYWGTPAAGQPRIDLANRFARWFNTDLGWEEQYYCAYNETGTGKLAQTPQAPTAKWGPVAGHGLVALQGGTLTQDAGTFTAKGQVYEFSGVTGGFKVTPIFNDHFENYRVVLDFDTAVADGDVGMVLWNGGASSGAVYNRNYAEINASGAVSGAVANTQATVLVARTSGAAGGPTVVDIFGPKKARRTYFQARSIDATNFQRIMAGSTGANVGQYDGLEVRFSGGMTMAGRMHVYGYNGMV
jgi:hypothetical protein